MSPTIMLRLLAIFVLSALSGCAFHHTPYAMYEGAPSLAETTVFAAVDDKQTKHVAIGIQQIDGKEPSCWQVGCPIWTRVLPGTHKFSVRYSSNFGLAGGMISYQRADLEVEVKDMKPRHVYVARYRDSGGRVSVLVEDLGENPQFGVWVGLEGANRKYHPVNF